MEQDILGISFDWKKTQADADKVAVELERILALGDKFAAIKLSFADNTAGFAASKKNADELTKSVKEQIEVTGNYNKVLATNTTTTEKNIGAYDKLKKQYAEAAKEAKNLAAEFGVNSDQALKAAASASTYKEQLDAIDKAQKKVTASKPEPDIPFTHNLNADGTVKEPAQGKTSGATVSDVEKMQVQGTLTANEYAAAQKGVSASYVQSNADAKKYILTEKEKQLALVQDKIQLQQQGAALKNQVKEELAVKGSLEQRRLALERLKKTYDNLAPAERSSAFGERLKTTIQGVNTQVLELEKTTGRAQRNVGNYGSAFIGAGKAAFGFLRTAAAILPGIGIAGIIGFGVDAITDLVIAATKGTNELNRLAEGHKNYVDTLEEGAKSSAKEVVSLRVLEKVATDISKPMSVRLEAVKDLQKEYPKYLGNLSQEAILNGSAAAQINLVADALYKKAFAEAASNKAAEFGGKQLDLELRKNFLIQRQQIVQKELNSATSEFNSILAKTPKDQQKFLVNSDIGKYQIELTRLNNLLKGNSEQYDFNGKQIKFFTDKAAENFDVVKKLEIDPKAKKAKDVKTISDAVADLRKELSGIQKNVDIGQLTLKEADVDRVKAYKKAFDQIFERGGKAGSPIVQTLVVELSPISQRVLEGEIRDLVGKLNKSTKADKLEIPVAKDKFLKEQTKAYEDSIKFRQTVAAKDYAVAQDQLLKQYTSGKISKKQYDDDLLKIQEDYSTKAIQLQIDEYQSALKYAFIGVENTQENADKRLDIEKKLAELQLELDNKVAGNHKKSLDKRREDLVSFLEKAQSAFAKVGELLSGVVNIGTTNQKNALQDLEDKQQKNYENDIARINNSTDSEATKANKLKLLESKRQAQKEENDRKNREADRKKAEFDKQIGIMNIILNGTVAVVKAAGRSLFEAIAVGALFAAELAIAIATPVPHAQGLLNNQKEHIALVGEVGPEIVRIPGQNPFIADRPTTLFLPKGSDVINEVMYRSMSKQAGGLPKNKEDVPVGVFYDIRNGINKLNSKKSSFQFNFKHDPSWTEYKRKYYS